MALAIAAFSLLSYCSSRSYNPVTDETQYVGISPEQEIALGLQAAPEMIQEFGGTDADQQAQAVLDGVCERLWPTVKRVKQNGHLNVPCWQIRKRSMPLPCLEANFLLRPLYTIS